MKSNLSALIAGILFALGLIVSDMVNPRVILGFLDIFGSWNPSLIFVIGAALCVVFIGFKLSWLRDKPLFESHFHIPSNNTRIDKRLLIGASLFGIGWGLSGLCPGPALVGLATLKFEIMIFIIAMIIGMELFDLIDQKIMTFEFK